MATMSLGGCDVFSALIDVGVPAHAERLIAQRETHIKRIGLLVILRSAVSQRHLPMVASRGRGKNTPIPNSVERILEPPTPLRDFLSLFDGEVLDRQRGQSRGSDYRYAAPSFRPTGDESTQAGGRVAAQGSASTYRLTNEVVG